MTTREAEVAVELTAKRASLALDLQPLSAVHLVRLLHVAQRQPLPPDVAYTAERLLDCASKYFADCPSVTAELHLD